MANPEAGWLTKYLVAGAALLTSALPFASASAHHPDHIDQLRAALGLTLTRPETDGHKTARDAARAMTQLRTEAFGLTTAHTSDDDDNDDFDNDFEDFLSELRLISRGRRTEPDATTDVWALNGFAYTGTFNSPCGGTSDSAGVHVWKVRGGNDSKLATVILSPVGSRANDVKVARMNSGTILVHSNEACNGGPGGFEIFNVKDPRNPVHLASVRIDELNPLADALFGGVTDVGVHNLWLFTQGDQDFVSVVSESVFDNFRIYDITQPTSPVLVGAWGAEEVFDSGVGDLDDPDNPEHQTRVLDAVLWLLGGVGASQNRFLHDITGTADGNLMYLSNWDAGLILLDVGDPSDPQVVSVALDETASDGEVNSHAAWPSEDGTIVVETEEDFAPFALNFSITSGPNAGDFPAAEGTFTTPINSLPGLGISGQTVYAGFACSAPNPGFDDAVPAAGPGQIALIQRGACRFDEKATNAINAGYSAMVVFNSAAGGDGLVAMGGGPRDIVGVFVGRSTGLAIAGVDSADDLGIGNTGADISAATVPDGWGDVRIWDYSDPENPVLASIFSTVCSAQPTDPSCDPAGTYSVHNVIVETEDDDGDRRVKAYLSHYWDGVLILDITDPFNPVEIARFSDTSAAFEEQNGGHQDFWGIYKEPGRDRIFASDRNGGLYVFKEKDLDDDDDDDDDDSFRIASGDD